MVSTTQQILLLSDDLLLSVDDTSDQPECMTVTFAQGHRCFLDLLEVNSGNNLYSGVMRLIIGEVERKLVDQAITVRYASG